MKSSSQNQAPAPIRDEQVTRAANTLKSLRKAAKFGGVAMVAVLAPAAAAQAKTAEHAAARGSVPAYENAAAKKLAGGKWVRALNGVIEVRGSKVSGGFGFNQAIPTEAGGTTSSHRLSNEKTVTNIQLPLVDGPDLNPNLGYSIFSQNDVVGSLNPLSKVLTEVNMEKFNPKAMRLVLNDPQHPIIQVKLPRLPDGHPDWNNPIGKIGGQVGPLQDPAGHPMALGLPYTSQKR